MIKRSPFSFRVPEPASPQHGPLSGLRFAVKDNVPVCGHPVFCGLSIPVIERASASAEVVILFEHYGATLVGSTIMDELAISGTGRLLCGAALENPLYPGLIPGGSSSGLGVALAEGSVDFGIGTDSGGSVRIPAACCGITGLSSPNLLPSTGVLLLEDLIDMPGLMATSPALLSTVCRTIRHVEPSRPTEFLVPSPASIGELEISVSSQFDDVIAIIRKSSLLGEERPEVRFFEAMTVRKQIISHLFATFVSTYAIPRSSLGDEASALLQLGEGMSSGTLQAADKIRVSIHHETASWLSEGQFLLTPAMPHPPPRAGIGGASGDDLNRFMVVANVAGLPAITFPVLNTKSSYPLALHLIGSIGSELELCEAAITLQNLLSS